MKPNKFSEEDISKMGFNQEIELKDPEEKQFTQVPNYVICDHRISSIAKTIMSYVIMRNGIKNWVFKKSEIELHLKEGEKPITRGFEELEQFGYLIQSPFFYNKQGKRDRRYHFFKDPASNLEYKGDLPDSQFYEKKITQKKLFTGEQRVHEKSIKGTHNQIIPEIKQNITKNTKKINTGDNFDEMRRMLENK